MDLVLGILLVVALTVLLFWTGRACGELRPKYVPDLIVLAAVGIAAVYGLWGRDAVLLARVLPFSNLVVLSNLFPPLAGLIAGLIWEKKATPAWRRATYVLGLTAAAGYSIAAPLLGRIPDCRDQWNDGVCMQTTEATCSAACGATVLHAHGIETSEEEMARLCLTRTGTLWHGLYRGLKLKTAGSDVAVEVFSGTADDLRRLMPGPVILTVGIPRGSNVDPLYTERYSWTPGKLHSVVLYNFADNNRVDMGDPSVGREQWTVEDLQVLYRGKGLRLVRR